MRSECSAFTKLEALTVALNHERLDDIVSDQLKIGVADPMVDGGLGAGEKVVDNGDLMTQEHQTVNEVGSDETGTTGNQYTLALKSRQEFNGWETRESRVGDRASVWMKYGLGLIRLEPLEGFFM